MAWFGNNITKKEIEELKVIKYLMMKSNDKFVFKNPPNKNLAQTWNIENWQDWLDKVYKESIK
jgi:hypothetical protein|tara:strand:- start:6274 stop:6462 length:189 start_codon:yes stop_codon:yes gene_type:complete